MTQEIEIELKNLLTASEMRKLHTELDFPETPQVQTNYYFETDNLALKAQHAALRIRQKNDTYTLTLKEPHPEGLSETHDKLTHTEAKEWLDGQPFPKANTSEHLTRHGIQTKDLKLFGELMTKRWEVTYNGVQIVLDHSLYHGKTDFELEVEGPTREAVSRVYDSLLETYDIPLRPTPNKIQRLFNELSN